MKRNWIRALLIGLSLVTVLPVQAALPTWLQPYPLAQLEQDRQQQTPDYRVLLARILKINGLIRADRELRLSGELQRLTWQLPSDIGPGEGFRFMREQLQKQGAEILFECTGRNCGASNVWANDLFQTSRLYGVDQTQSYLAARRGQTYLVLYAVRRGNGRVYLHLELLDSDRQDGGDWASVLLEQGYAELPDWPKAPEPALRALIAVLNDHPALRLRIVVHQAGIDAELAVRQSRELAQRLVEELVREGVAAQRLESFGIGPLAPSVLGGREQLAVIMVAGKR